jgi:hypothetical protein
MELRHEVAEHHVDADVENCDQYDSNQSEAFHSHAACGFQHTGANPARPEVVGLMRLAFSVPHAPS